MAMPTLTERATAQEAVTDTTVYEVVEKMPEYPGGWKVLVKDVRAYADGFWKRKYPKGRPMQRYESIHCRVVVSFIVNENGEVYQSHYQKECGQRTRQRSHPLRQVHAALDSG